MTSTENTPTNLSDEQKKELNIVDENFKKIEEVIDDKNEESDDDEGEEELLIEPEDCEYCKQLAEKSGIEYAQEYHIKDGIAICDGCGRSM